MVQAAPPTPPAAPPDAPDAATGVAPDGPPDVSTQADEAPRLERTLHGGAPDSFEPGSPAGRCLMPLLRALGWRGASRHLAEALPHFADSLDVADLRTVLANLGYRTVPERTRAGKVDPRLLPALFVDARGRPFVLHPREADGALPAYDGTRGRTYARLPARMPGTLYRIERVDAAARGERLSWFARVALRFRPLLWLLLGISLLTNVLALAVPLFIMAVYDTLVASGGGATTGAATTLYWLIAGVGLAVTFDCGLRLLRARVLAYIGGRIDILLGQAAFQQVIGLPLSMTERAPVGAQITRFRQFESVREFFTSPLATVALDLPFVALFLAAIAVLAGWLALMPLVLVLVFLGFAWLLAPAQRNRLSVAGQARGRRQSFLIELMTNLEGVRAVAAEPTWMARFRAVSAEASLAQRRAQAIGGLAQAAGQTLMLAAGVAALLWGTLMALDGTLSLGGLVAVMALVWRVLAPLQLGFLSFTRLEQLRIGLGQLNRLMQLKQEGSANGPSRLPRRFDGALSFSRVSFRYAASADPALLGVTLHVPAGQSVAIVGQSGAGKSTLLKLAAGLYEPQGGTIALDGLDIRQFDPAELRTAMGFVLQDCELFHGTIAQNLRLADPAASDAELNRAAHDSGLLPQVLALPEGFHTRLTDTLARRLPNGFRQRLSLARTYVQRPPVYLMDEPAARLDDEGDRALLQKLDALRGRATVLMVTHRPSHMRAVDRVVVLQGGQISDDGPPEAVLARMRQGAA
jgi:ATP-binding cassette subfamily C protein/ATP-binding cassette subfamily C protein LapB